VNFAWTPVSKIHCCVDRPLVGAPTLAMSMSTTGLDGEQSIAIQAPGEVRVREQVLIVERRAAFASVVLEAPIEIMEATYYISRLK
jgi:hypothetical protein